MSVSIQDQVWKSGLCGNEMLVMQALGDCADDDGYAYPSVAYLSWKTGLARSTVQSILSSFRDRDFLSGLTGGGDTSSRYRIAVSKLPIKESWQRLKGRKPGTSGRGPTPPDNQAASLSGSPKYDAPRPNQQATLPEMDLRNKEEPSFNHQEKHHRFVRPTREQVSIYCQERQNNVDAQKWFDYYESNGWRVGKNPMRDWRAAVRTWERNDNGKANHRSTIAERLGNERRIARDFAERNPARANGQCVS